MSRNTYFLDQRRLASPHDNLLTNDLSRFPLPLVFILIGVLRVKFLDIQVFNIGDRVRDTPGDMLVVPNYHASCTGKTCSNHIDIPCHQVAFVPDRWNDLSQVRVIAEDGRTGRAHRAIDHPVVASAQHAKSAQLLQLFILFQHAQVDALVFYAGRNNQWMVGIIA